ncbi:MAG: radical SAM family heme chaperone HemW [Lentisphaerae bacterium]|nr:radical SAM family heme chaperone HemW [Lentisphaerota bacterium]
MTTALPPAAWRRLYVHVPFCRDMCAYCALYSEVYRPDRAARYVRAVAAEIGQLRGAAPRPRPETVYIGGGTPTVLAAGELDALLGVLKRQVDLSAAAEWTVESNPAVMDAARAALLRSHGVSRVSLGVQSFEDEVLRAMGRPHGADDARSAAAALRRAGFDNVGLDLIAGLPGVGAAAWRRTLREAVALEPEHLSVYALAVERGTRLARAVRAGTCAAPDDDALLDALDKAGEILRAAGYTRYELSNYARPGRQCLHNAAVWRGADYLGIGPGAASRAGLRRWTNVPDVASYAAALLAGRPPPRGEETVAPGTDAVERVVFKFRTAEGVGDADADALPEALRARWRTTLRALRGHGLLARAHGRWRLTRRGRQVADAVIGEFV